jgi:hypothetical protein
VKALQCYSHFASFFSQQDVTERIFPTLVKCAFQKSTPHVRVAIVGACSAISVKAGEQFTAAKILPFIIPLMVDKEMGTKQARRIALCYIFFVCFVVSVVVSVSVLLSLLLLVVVVAVVVVASPHP